MNSYRVTTSLADRSELTREVKALSAADAVTQVETELKRQKPRLETFERVEPIAPHMTEAKLKFMREMTTRPQP